MGCGEEFSRPGTWPGQMHYCSNKCSHAQQKKTRDKYVLNLSEHAVVFHSGWEIRFYAACLRFDIPIRSYDGPDIQTSQGVYRPDFIITTTDGKERIMEVKGWLRPEARDKIREAQCLGYRIFVLSKDQLLRLETGDSLDAHRMLDWGVIHATST
jgi:predicted nuclease of restriction endonuclease-like RecB superfamily